MSLTENGFQRKRLPEIKSDYDELLTDALGPVNTAPDAVLGQMSGIWSEALDSTNETLQATYDAMYPFSAENTGLDGAVSFVRMKRLGSTPTIVPVIVYGEEGTIIPDGSFAHADIQYTAMGESYISRTQVVDCTFEIVTALPLTTYVILAAGVVASYTSDTTPTRAEIAAGLLAQLTSSSFIASVLDDEIRLVSANGEIPFSVTAGENLNIKKRGSIVYFKATIEGKRTCAIGALSSMDTRIEGLDSIINLKAGVVGRDVETDAELRARHELSPRINGTNSNESIKARLLQEIPEITYVRIYENRTASEDANGLPPYSFETIVSGGSDEDVRRLVWLYKASSVSTHGNVSGSVVDSNGDQQQVYFSRPLQKYAWLTIGVTLYTEEPLTASANLGIKQACVDYALENISIGKDIIIERFKGAIYSKITGIGNITISAALTDTENGAPSYSIENIPMGRSGIAIFDVSRITVTGT